MSEHYDDKGLLAFIRKQASAEDVRDIENHLQDCSFCYADYLELVKHEQDRSEIPEESFVSGILNQLQKKGPATPEISFRVVIQEMGVRFFDALNRLIPQVEVPAALHSLSGGATSSGAISIQLASVKLIVQIVSENRVRRLSLSTAGEAKGLSATAVHDGREVETILLSSENAFQTPFTASEYTLQVRRADTLVGNILMTLA